MPLIYSKLGDLELSLLLKEDDRHAFTEIYDRYKAPLYVHAYNKLRNTEEAKDLVQELFVSLWNNRNTHNLGGHLSSYLYAAVRNRVFRVISRLGSEYIYISSIENSINKSICITDHRIREKQLLEMIDREIDALPPKMREVFILSRKEHLSHLQIAEKLNIAEPTVKKQINNALKVLRLKLGIFTFLLFLIYH
jgi:RNA polymerase sigma-70 factor (family 1)